MRRIGQRTWAEYISNLSSVEEYECKHTNVNSVYGKPTVKDGKSTFWKWYSTWTILCERLIYKGTLPSESFIEKPCVLSELSTELEALKELPEWTVKTQTVRYVNITSNWISEIQQCFWSTQQPYGRIQYFNSQLLGINNLAFTFIFCIDFIDFIFLCFYHHLSNYCNHVFSDQSSNVVCRCLYRGYCYFNMYTVKQSNWPEISERRYKISLCKVC